MHLQHSTSKNTFGLPSLIGENMKSGPSHTECLAALRIVAIYAMVAALWIYLSDNVLSLLVQDKDTLYHIAVFKGFVFIIVTGILLYQLIARHLHKARLTEENLRVSRNLTNSLIEGTTDAIFVKDLQGRYLLFNSAAEKITGKTAAEVIGQDDTFLFSGEEAGLIMAGDRRVIDAGVVITYEDFITAADGVYRTFLTTKGPIFDAEGEVCGVFGISRDITAYARAEEILKESEKRHRSLFENMLEGYAYCRMIYDDQGAPADYEYLEVNSSFVRLTGLIDVVAKKVTEVIPDIKTMYPELFETCGRVAVTGQPERFDLNFEPLKKWFSISVYSSRKDYFVTVFDSISERKRAEESREATIELLRICNKTDGLQELMRSLVLFFRKFTGCEAVGVRLRQGEDFPYLETSGFTEEFVLAENRLCALDQAGEIIRDYAGHPVYDCMCGNIICGRYDPVKSFFTAQGSFWTNSTTDLLASTTEADRQARTRNRCNGEGYESVALIPLKSQGETFGLFQFNDKRRGRFSAEIISQLEDMVAYVSIALAKLKVDAELQEATHRLQLAITSMRLGIWDRDIANDVLVWDDRMFEIYGIDRNSFKSNFEAWNKCLHEDDVAGVLEANRAAIIGERAYDTEFRIILPDGTVKNIKANGIVIRNSEGKAIRMIGLNQDITEQKHMEQQLRQAQKMEAIGQLAGGIAHDFNNILTVIYGYGYMMQLNMEENSPHRASVEQVLIAAERAANLTRSLLAFSRKQTMSPKTVNINDLVMNVGKLLTRIIGEDIQLKTVFTINPLLVFADSGQVEQILMNLAANARDAMPEGGLLSIETKLQEINEDFIHAHGYGTCGKYVVMSVSDTGKGMDGVTTKKIFEPFFTTKEVGKGTGLGLSIVFGVVKQHNGYINVYSEVGKGTTFRIYLPIVVQEPADNELVARLDNPQMGAETVLVAEDDASIRQLIESILTKYGYTVIFANDGVDAVEKFEANCDKIDIVVMDMIMPRKSGKEAYAEIKEMRPDVKVLFMSGYSSDLLYSKGFLKNDEQLLIKPIQPLDFVRKVRTILDQKVQ
jgi:two-component system, cell cycle sensor histidine kinase and response regulator CckA